MHMTWIEMDCSLILSSKHHCAELIAENIVHTCDSSFFLLMVFLLNLYPLYPRTEFIAGATKVLKGHHITKCCSLNRLRGVSLNKCLSPPPPCTLDSN